MVAAVLGGAQLLFPARGTAALQPETVRVALLKQVESVRLDGTAYLASDDRGAPLGLSLPAMVRSEGGGVTVEGKRLRKLVVSAPDGLKVEGKLYRGIIEIVPAERGLLVVNELPVEDYLVGLINCEISSQWPIEAVKAQAVVARSYALFQKEARKGAPYHLESSVLDQVYDGSGVEDPRSARGVRETEGEVLAYGGRTIQAFFHSVCGGHTEAAEQVWGTPVPYLEGVRCGYCSDSPAIRWEQAVPLRKIEAALRAGGVQLQGLREVRAGGRNRTGRLISVVLLTSRGSQEIPAVKFRKLVGYGVIRSTDFRVRMSGDDALFSGNGYGHGVGLCQWGARSRASAGFSYREILSYYYPGATLRQLYQ
ncbi:MAG TPA: SpoIID/LytB domain-containing protein [Verrucomicrobiae bacterium]|nr:SpoIID/LytB domain-containing protein [Verrucomicrobiae bacterium]